MSQEPAIHHACRGAGLVVRAAVARGRHCGVVGAGGDDHGQRSSMPCCRSTSETIPAASSSASSTIVATVPHSHRRTPSSSSASLEPAVLDAGTLGSLRRRGGSITSESPGAQAHTSVPAELGPLAGRP